MIAEALIGAASSALGGLLGNKSAKEANQAAERNAQKQYEQQKEFAQSGIQWKVADAEKAGIHPLYAMGANTVSYAPQSIGSTPSNFDFVGQAGQNIGRAIDATRSNPAKQNALALTASKIQLEGLQLDNEIKKAQLASTIATANPFGRATPGLPGTGTTSFMDGQGNTPQSDPIPPLMHSARQPQYTTNVRVAGRDIQPSPHWSDGQTFQDRYGEPGEWAAAVPIAVSDYLWNTRHLRDPVRLKKLSRQMSHQR